MRKPPYLVVEKEYWLCPVHVFTGLFWLLIGLGLGVGVTVVCLT